jgi:DNA-binding transcriptional LysR family regulator
VSIPAGYASRMELRHLRYFVAVAEEQNVTRAAARLHVSQPPLSRQIRELEDELGVKLFERTAKSIEITPAGEVFLVEARAVLQRVNQAIQTLKAVSGRKISEIHVGYAPSLTVEILPRALRGFETAEPGVRAHLHDLSTDEMLERLHDRELDVALMIRPAEKRMRGLVFEKLEEYRVAVALYPGHLLASREKIGLMDILNDRLIGYERTDYPEYHEQIGGLCRKIGRIPKFSEEHESVTSLIAAVEAGRGVALVPEVLACMTGPRLVVRPLNPEPEKFVVGAARRKGNQLAEAFVKASKVTGK